MALPPVAVLLFCLLRLLICYKATLATHASDAIKDNCSMLKAVAMLYSINLKLQGLFRKLQCCWSEVARSEMLCIWFCQSET
ncbi:hypothetical protein LOK49_Contig29G00012 [Camellia lanceoleosa]|nr:hypothetical protein LOK49_Contig29G00012 [Camellia lanceoleosa]